MSTKSNSNANAAYHPSYQQLLDYANNKSDMAQDFVKHISQCENCQQEISIINEMRVLLNNRKANEIPSHSSVHLTDEVINEYVYERLTVQDRTEVDQHLQHCDSCMTEILSFRMLLEEKRGSAQAITGRVTPIKPHRTMKTIVSLAIAASLLLLTFTYMLPVTNKKNETISSNTSPDLFDNLNKSIPSNAFLPVNSKGQVVVNNGRINWYGAYVETDAVGTVDMSKMTNSIQAEILAEKTARANAYAQLSEILNGVQITQQSTYEDMLMQVDRLSMKSSAFIRNAKVINKKIEWIDDNPKFTITMRVPLFGNNSVQSIVTPYIPNIDKPMLTISDAEFLSTAFDNYTGIIIDTRNTNFQPALFAILASSDEGVKTASRHFQANYYPNVESINKEHYPGKNPYVIKANIQSDGGRIAINAKEITRAVYMSKKSQSQNIPVLY